MCASSHLQEQPCVFDSPGSPVLICEHKDLNAFCSASVHMGRGQSENSWRFNSGCVWLGGRCPYSLSYLLAPILKLNSSRRCSLMVELLLSMYEATGLNSLNLKKEKKKESLIISSHSRLQPKSFLPLSVSFDAMM